MDLKKKQSTVVDALEDVKGYDIVVFNTASMPTMFERVVIATGTSNTQVKALADRVRERIEQAGGRVYGVEGAKGGEWVLVDLGDVVVHIMHPAVRSFYNLEEVWGAKAVKLKAEKPAAAKKPAARKPAAKKPAPKRAAPKKTAAKRGAPARRRARR
jgi:ribosome-associated protein